MMSRRLRADLLLLLMCVFWGGTFVLVKEALADASTLLFLMLRFGLAAVVLIAFGGRPWRAGVPALLAGTFLFLGYFLQTQGLRWTTPSKSAFLTGLAVVLVPVGQSVIARAFPGWGVLAGVAMALGGLALLTNMGWSTSIGRGDIWTLGCALAFTVHILLIGHFSPRLRALDFAAGQVLIAALLGALSFPWAETPMLHSSARLWLAVVVTGLLCTALGFFSQAWAQQFTTSAHTALIFSSEPVFAWITSAVLLGERLGARATAGALLILTGIIAAELLANRDVPHLDPS